MFPSMAGKNVSRNQHRIYIQLEYILLLYLFWISFCPACLYNQVNFSPFFNRHLLQGQFGCSIVLLKASWIPVVQLFHPEYCLEFLFNSIPSSLPNQIDCPDLHIRIGLGNIGIWAPVVSHPDSKFLGHGLKFRISQV